MTTKGETRDVKEYHKSFHPSEAITHATAHTKGILFT